MEQNRGWCAYHSPWFGDITVRLDSSNARTSVCSADHETNGRLTAHRSSSSFGTSKAIARTIRSGSARGWWYEGCRICCRTCTADTPSIRPFWCVKNDSCVADWSVKTLDVSTNLRFANGVRNAFRRKKIGSSSSGSDVTGTKLACKWTRCASSTRRRVVQLCTSKFLLTHSWFFGADSGWRGREAEEFRCHLPCRYRQGARFQCHV